ncbi:MAG: hypothetical protein AAGH15_27225 [Myxococcota bacterium]
MSGALVIALAALATFGGLVLLQRGRTRLAAAVATLGTLAVGAALASGLEAERRAEPTPSQPISSLWAQRPAWTAPGCEEAPDPAVCSGLAVHHVRGCDRCHGLEDGGASGYSFASLWGTKRPLEGGEQVLVDRAYLLRSLLRPDYDLPAGHAGARMPRARLRGYELDALEALFVELADGSLRPGTRGPVLPAADGADAPGG